ncbi:unnamed protein product [Sympodiomycopsis kandeliae]
MDPMAHRLSTARESTQYDWGDLSASTSASNVKSPALLHRNSGPSNAQWVRSKDTNRLKPDANSFVPPSGRTSPSLMQCGKPQNCSSSPNLSAPPSVPSESLGPAPVDFGQGSKRPSVPVIIGTPATPLRKTEEKPRCSSVQLPRRSLPFTDGTPGTSSPEALFENSSMTRHKPTKRGTRSGKRVQNARSEKALRQRSKLQEFNESIHAEGGSPLPARPMNVV